MAFVKAEDTTGTVDIVIFPKLYQDVKSILADGKVAIVTGKVDLREDEISFLVESMEEVKYDSSHLISVPVGTEKEKLVKLKELLVENSGDDTISLHFEESGKKILAKQKVKWSEELEEKIGKILE